MHSVFDFYPFNLPVGGPFLHFFLFFSLGVTALVYFLRHKLAPELVDRVEGDGERTPGEAASPFAKGRIPHADALFTIAYLRGGVPAVANLLAPRAVGEGWLTPDQGDFDLHVNARPRSPLSRELFDLLDTAETGNSVMDAAQSVAERHEGRFHRELVAAGLLRDRRRANRYVLLMLVPVALVFAVGVIRVLWLMEIHRPFFNLLLAMTFVAGAGCLVAFRGRQLSSRAKPHLAWLRDATISLRDDVALGRRVDPADVALAVAVGGAALLTEGRVFAGIDPALADERPLDPSMIGFEASGVGTERWWNLREKTSDWSGSGGGGIDVGASSWYGGCAGSTCGSGGGCGGGGCGGGGGCS